MRAKEFLSELFDPKHAVPLEWSTEFDGEHAYGQIGEKTLDVTFVQDRQGVVILTFNVDNSFQVTGKGDTNSVFSTVIHAVAEYVHKHPDATVFVFTANEKSRARMYDALAKRVSKQLGWHVVPHEEVMNDPKYADARQGSYAFVVEKGHAPEHRQGAQKPQHEKFKDIWYVGSMEDKTLPVFKVSGGKGWEAEQFVMHIRPEYKDFHPMGMYSTHTAPKGQQIIDLGDYKTLSKVSQ